MALKIRQKLIQKSSKKIAHSKRVLGVILGPSDPQIHASRAGEVHFHTFSCFSYFSQKCDIFVSKMTPKCSPKWSKNMTKNLMEVGTNFGWILEPFWPHFGRLGGPMGSIFGAKIAPWATTLTKIGPKSSQKRLFCPPGGPKACQSAPKVPKGPHF